MTRDEGLRAGSGRDVGTSPGPTERPALGADAPSVPDLAPWIARRATVRNFDPEATIPDSEIRELIDAGRKAPTSGTTQMYSFVWVRDQDTRERIHDLCDRGTVQVEEASHFLVVCIDLRRNRLLLDRRDRDFGLPPLMGLLEGTIDASLAAMATMLAAESRGYGVCPIGNILNGLDDIARLLDLPAGVLPIYGLCIGVPVDDAPKENCPRIPLEAVLHEETYRDPGPDLLEACYERMDRMYGDSVYGDEQTRWEDTLHRYWGSAGFMRRREPTIRRTLRQQGFMVNGPQDSGDADDGEPETDDPLEGTAEPDGDAEDTDASTTSDGASSARIPEGSGESRSDDGRSE